MRASDIKIPVALLDVRFSRSGGPGGQNVNKVETKVEIRFRLAEAGWIPARARERLAGLQAGKVNQEGDLVVSSSRFRSQGSNLQDCLSKLREMILAASRPPRRRIPTRPTGASRAVRKRQKKHRSERKTSRRWRGDWD